jgi:hypothetical protein
MKTKIFLLIALLGMVLTANSCASKKKQDKSDFQVMVVTAPLQCDAEPKELHAECKCPEHKESIATTISAIGSVIGNLVSTLWD